MASNAPTDILTLEEARSRLHAIKPLVEELHDTTLRIQEIESAAAATDAVPDSGSREELLSGYNRFREILDRINELGAYVKDPGTGLLDFYCWRGSDLVFLCWHRGEDTIRYWHGLQDGYAGRRPVSEL